MLTPDKQKYNFAMTCFVRMWGRSVLTDIKIKEFCVEWACKDEHAPLDDKILDQYFYYEFKTWRGN